MKNQYFADINDYRKYGLLRLLAGEGQLKIAVCWMLTENDQRTDGNAIAYLNHPGKWRPYDPLLFDALKASLAEPGNRAVNWAETYQLIPSAIYCTDVLSDLAADRQRFFESFHQRTAVSDLVFFDPDTGIQVKSVPYGRKDSRKYIYWDELSHAFAAGHSLLVYQHWAHVQRDVFRTRLAREFHDRLGVREIVSLSTANVLFLLIPQERHRTYLVDRVDGLPARWDAQIQVCHHRSG